LLISDSIFYLKLAYFSVSGFPRFSILASISIDDRFGSGLDDTMKTKPLVVFSCFALLSVAFVGAASAADTKIEQTLRDLDVQWAKAVEAKDLDKSVSYYSDDAIVLPPNAAIATTKEAIRNIWKDLLASPGLVFRWKTTKVEVAKSGDMAYSSGTYELTMNDAGGKPVNDHGKYIVVWEKQADGKWKCGADIWNSDLPAIAPAPAGKK
jgi:ketosteroid isomerase-like protein